MAHAIRSVCSLDQHAGIDKHYAIRSLYLDSSQLDLYWANEREQPDRYKARIRTYPPHFANAWLEIKARSGDSIHKTRYSIPVDTWADVVQNPDPKMLAAIDPKKRQTLERFLYYVHAHGLEPIMMVEYDREAYFSHVDDYARVTFDRHIRSQDQTEWTLDASSKRWRVVDHPAQTHTHSPMCVVELKFGALVPRWMHLLVQNFELIRYSFSKYCYSIDGQKILPRGDVASAQASGW